MGCFLSSELSTLRLRNHHFLPRRLVFRILFYYLPDLLIAFFCNILLFWFLRIHLSFYYSCYLDQMSRFVETRYARGIFLQLNFVSFGFAIGSGSKIEARFEVWIVLVSLIEIDIFVIIQFVGDLNCNLDMKTQANFKLN